MKKIIDFIIRYKTIFITLGILIYGLLLRLYIPYHIPIHENNHGIFFINELYNINYDLKWILGSSIFVNNIFIEQMNYGLGPKYFYSFLLNSLGFSYKIIFITQIIFNLLTILFLSLSLYKLSGKRLLYYIVLLLGVILPYNIKFSSTDEFLIFGNFFIVVSYYLYILFFEKEKYQYFYFSIIFYLLALYTRNLYLIFSIFYIIGLLYYLFLKKYNNLKLFIHFFIGLGIFFLLSLSRIKVFLFTKNEKLNSGYIDYFNELYGLFLSSLTPNLYIIFIFSSIILPIYFFIKNKLNYINIFFYYISILILYILLILLINTNSNFLLQERLQNIFIPAFILLSSIGLYFLILKFKYKYILLGGLLLIPYFYIEDIQNIYSSQKDYLFIENNFEKLGDNFNLVILGASEQNVFNNFPEFLIKDKEYKIYWINGDNNKYDNFIDNYKNLKSKNNYFILSYDCYRGQNIGKYMRKECEYIENNYLLEIIAEKYILNKPYIFNNISLQKELKIGIYKIIGEK